MTGIYTDSDGAELTVIRTERVTRYYNARGEYHRLDGPAYEYSDVAKEWFQNDQLHRLVGPAVECGSYINWYVEGKEVEPMFLVAYWLERGRCCWYDESTQELRFGDQ